MDELKELQELRTEVLELGLELAVIDGVEHVRDPWQDAICIPADQVPLIARLLRQQDGPPH